MFERNRIDNATRNREKPVPVELAIDDGRIVKGQVFLPASRQIYDELNQSGGFLEFQAYDGPRELIAKTTVRSVRQIEIPSEKPLAAGRAISARQGDFDPYSVLGIEKGAPFEAAREAYFRLSKKYHPDRFANVELPEEISDYLEAMSRRLNAAFAALEKPLQSQRQINRAKTEPIYQRG